MGKKKIFIGIICALFVILGGAGLLYDYLGGDIAEGALGTGGAVVAAKNGNESQERIKAPDFTVYDNDGKQVKLSDFRGKPVVLNFWASWCPPCKREMPDFNEAHIKQGQDVSFLMVNMTDGSRETTDKAAAYIKQMGFALPVFYDKDGSAADAYKIRSLPSTYFIDAEGRIAAHAVGAIDSAALQHGIDKIKIK